jgi:hypothetical protein
MNETRNTLSNKGIFRLLLTRQGGLAVAQNDSEAKTNGEELTV